MRTLTSKKGDSLETPHSDADAMHKLCELRLDNSFAQDLIRKSTLYTLSEAQWYWVHKLVLDAENRPPIVPIPNLWTLFTDSKLKTPRICLIKLRLAWYKERISVFWKKEYRGFINQEGFHRTEENIECLRGLIKFSADPKMHCVLYGQRTGNCCYCGKQLITKESKSVGYGPTCADKWNLPWGDVDPVLELKELREENEINLEKS